MSPAGAGKPGSPAGLPRVNYAQELVVRAGRDPDDSAVLRNPTQDHANHSHAESPAMATHFESDAARRCRCRAGPAPPRQAAAAIPSDAFPDDRLMPLPHAPLAARFVREEAD